LHILSDSDFHYWYRLGFFLGHCFFNYFPTVEINVELDEEEDDEEDVEIELNIDEDTEHDS